MGFLSRIYYGDTLLDWAITFSLILVSVLAARALYWVLGFWIKRIANKTETMLDDILVDVLQGPVVCLVALAGTRLSLMRLHFSDESRRVISTVFSVLLALSTAWLIVRLYRAIHEGYLVPMAAKSATSFDDQILPVLRSGITLVIWALGLIIGLDNAGFNVSAILAGMGLGGLAFALAAQDTIANVFGGLTIFVQNPFKIGDLIIFEGKTGRVKEVGLRTTKLEDFDTAHAIYVPNSLFTKSSIINVSADPGHWVTRVYRLPPDTTAAKTELAIALIREAIGENPAIDKINCRLNTFDNHTIELYTQYHVKTFAVRWAVITEVHLAVMRRFEKNGLRFAVPLTVMYTEPTEKREPELSA